MKEAGMDASSKVPEIRKRYTPRARAIYQCKRYFFLGAILAGVLYLSGSLFILELVMKQAAKASFGLMTALIAIKFALPKIALQTELIEDQNIAVAIVVGAFTLGVCLA